jgi:hypothetical protein
MYLDLIDKYITPSFRTNYGLNTTVIPGTKLCFGLILIQAMKPIKLKVKVIQQYFRVEDNLLLGPVFSILLGV